MNALLLTLLLFGTVTTHGTGWIPLAPAMTARQEVAVAALNGKLYLIGGISGNAILSSVEQYDPATNQWTLVAPLPRPRHHAAAASDGAAIYVVGGYESLTFDPQSSVYRYDPGTNRWTEVAPLPAARGALAAAAIDGMIYAVGGVPGNRDLTVYDPAGNLWRTLSSMPTGREHLAAAGASGMLYVAGGRLAGNSAAFERYDPITATWTSLAPLPTARSGLAAAAIDGRVYVFGGEGNASNSTGVFEETESFDTLTGTWRSEPPMAAPRHGIAATAIGSRIHIPAGSPLQGFGTTAVHDALDVQIRKQRAVRH